MFFLWKYLSAQKQSTRKGQKYRKIVVKTYREDFVILLHFYFFLFIPSSPMVDTG